MTAEETQLTEAQRMKTFTQCEGCDDSFCSQIKKCVAEMLAEGYREEDEYIKAGVCRDCGACSLADAQGKCRPESTQEGEYSCGGDKLWEGQDP